MSRKRKSSNIAARFAASAGKRAELEKALEAERLRVETESRNYAMRERLAIQAEKEVVPPGRAYESTSERAARIALRNATWEATGGKVGDAYVTPVPTPIGPLELPLWREIGIEMTESRARKLAELFRLDRRDIYTIYYSP